MATISVRRAGESSTTQDVRWQEAAPAVGLDSRADLRRAGSDAPARGIATFLDTNVVVYAYDRDEPQKGESAQRIVAELPDLVVSTQVLIELFNVLTRRLRSPMPPADAAEAVDRVAALRVVGADAGFVRSAAGLCIENPLSIWDAMIVRAAQVGQCERVLTEDLEDGAEFGGVAIENPFRSL